MLTRARAIGLTRPGRSPPAWARTSPLTAPTSRPSPSPAEPDRDLPPEIMRQLCAHLRRADLRRRCAPRVELAIDTGRRPEEICDLAFDCLARDDDGLPVLIYDNHKANRPAPAAADQRAAPPR